MPEFAFQHALVALQPGSFRSKTNTMSATREDLLQAVELSLVGKWDAAHQFVQACEDDATVAWSHAVLHKLEGDPGNARYWYHRADQMSHVTAEPRAELAAIRAELTTNEHGQNSTRRILNR